RLGLGCAEAAAPRCFNNEYIACLHIGRACGAQLKLAAIAALHIAAAHLTRFAAFKPKGGNATAIGQDGCSHGFQETQTAYATMTAMHLACTAAAQSDFVAFKQNREAPFQYFGIGQARIGHVGLYGIDTVEVGGLAIWPTQHACA